jgi:hypothetical protein
MNVLVQPSVDHILTEVGMRRKRVFFITVLKMNGSIGIEYLLLTVKDLFCPTTVNFGQFG